MFKSDSIVNLAQALLKAERNIEDAKKDSKNPFFRSNYAGLPEVIDACKTQLNDEGIVVTQMVDSASDGEYLETIFIHAETGEYLGSKMKLQGVADGMQAFGSAITYARRYMLQSMAFVSSTDDDGNAATGKKDPPKPIEKKATKVDVSAASPATKSEAIAAGPEQTKEQAIANSIPTFSKKAVKAEIKKSAFED